MPKNGYPSRMFYATATKTTTHGTACTEVGIVGVAVKQKSPGATDALSTQKTIAIGEKFAIITKGVVEVPSTGLGGKGSTVYITTATNALKSSDAGAGDVAFGRVTEVPGERGLPAGTCRVDLDYKDNVPNA